MLHREWIGGASVEPMADGIVQVRDGVVGGTVVGAERKVDNFWRLKRQLEDWDMERRREAEVRKDSKASGRRGEWGNTGKVQVEEEKEDEELCSVPVCSGGKAKGWEPGELLHSLPGPPT